MKTLLFGAVCTDLEMLGSAPDLLEPTKEIYMDIIIIDIRRQQLNVLRREGVCRKSLQGTQRLERYRSVRVSRRRRSQVYSCTIRCMQYIDKTILFCEH